ncbi:hypothetical protein FDC06_09350 [Clostridium botulinum]|uniref:Uncharacterized protein n=1 Tax=Clostridium botulinum (strain Hall / ATCC 3502 / NCTC 13319 / Type A) TaxID=441771 RepID=A5I0Q9_CLOBH|nr:hypothetical protein DB732_05800 [Clostridium botulinum]EPS51945.1 hypothetical protein CFSAN002367_02309 [Clostridium botulinum CFSAN002367]CAL82620.1 hypothetical protein CBO1066 [Clostridium botulinum A str. ATCC 3502]AWB29783.1 hypothetical protein DBN47_05780 [Clostridium botulinum]EGT5614859.1 hypothetical protein [Clostridium botulinum]
MAAILIECGNISKVSNEINLNSLYVICIISSNVKISGDF